MQLQTTPCLSSSPHFAAKPAEVPTTVNSGWCHMLQLFHLFHLSFQIIANSLWLFLFVNHNYCMNRILFWSKSALQYVEKQWTMINSRTGNSLHQRSAIKTQEVEGPHVILKSALHLNKTSKRIYLLKKIDWKLLFLSSLKIFDKTRGTPCRAK